MRILLAIDDSKYSQAAADLVVRQMRPEGAEVCVFHAVAPLVIIPYDYMGQVETLEAAQQERLKEGQEIGGADRSTAAVGGLPSTCGNRRR